MARAGLTADRVTLAGADLADEVGLDRVTMSAVARRLGVKDASLYVHVRNLEDLRGRIALLAADEKSIRIAEATAGRAGKDALVAYANAYRDYAREHPGRYTATQSRARLRQGLFEAGPVSGRAPLRQEGAGAPPGAEVGGRGRGAGQARPASSSAKTCGRLK
ncbi:TetR/AcrR family transcriptional regulator [Nonomuraea candida]|uniref:TetR/AcrR family transcriptional regulator n=1 Tax=Nonomuraea candida TaxID=359159 RepID=UPI000A061168|nr:TetR family transcriptional regulator [Nonomuraea candida]